MFRNENFEAEVIPSFDVQSGTPFIDVEPDAREGIRFLTLNPTADVEHVGYNLPAGNRIAATTFWMRFLTFPAGTFTFASFEGPACALRWRQAVGRFNLAIFGATSQDFGPATLELRRWYLVDLFADSSTGTAEMKGRIDGENEGSTTRAQAAGDITAVFLGSANANTFNIDVDLWKIGLPPDNYPLSGLQGPGIAHIDQRIRHLRQGKLVRR